MKQGLVRMLFTCYSQFDSCEIKLRIMVHTSFHIRVYCLSSGQEDIFSDASAELGAQCFI